MMSRKISQEYLFLFDYNRLSYKTSFNRIVGGDCGPVGQGTLWPAIGYPRYKTDPLSDATDKIFQIIPGQGNRRHGTMHESGPSQNMVLLCTNLSGTV
jgi:hypothetical protein